MGLNVIKKVLWTDQAIGSTTIDTDWVEVLQLEKGSFSFVWSSGSSPVGEVQVIVSNRPQHDDKNVLTLTATLNVSGTDGSHVANLDVIPGRYVALRYVGTSGSAVADVEFVGKGRGQ